MPTYHVALTIERRTDVDDEALIHLLHDAAERSLCVAIDVQPTGLVIEGGGAVPPHN